MEDLVLQDSKIIEVNCWMEKDGNIGMKFLILDNNNNNFKELYIPKLEGPELSIKQEQEFYSPSGELIFKIKPSNGVLLELKDFTNEI